MQVVVGSTNPVKVEAVEAALAPLEANVSDVTVSSGVPEQPRTVTETVRGATNRARRAFELANADLAVGLEGGVEDELFDVVERPLEDGGDGRVESPEPETFLVMWAAATDGDRLVRGGGPSLRLPEEVADRIRGGEELGPVLDDELGTDGIARRAGAAGVFTGGLTDRRRALTQAVACAVGPLVADHGR